MSKKKRRPRMPNGFGTIKKLSGNRRNPYAVYPPATEFYDSGHMKRPPAIGYVDTWQKGFVILTAYHAGTYTPEMINHFEIPDAEADQLDSVIGRVLSDFRRIQGLPVDDLGPTFEDVYKKWYDWKFVLDKGSNLSEHRQATARQAYKAFSELADQHYKMILREQWQSVSDSLDAARGTVIAYQAIIKMIGKWALDQGITEKDETAGLRVTQAQSGKEKGAIPETIIKKLWEDKSDPAALLILLLCYTGLRIGEAQTVKIDLEGKTLFGGSKTEAGKDRLIPIHSAILPLLAVLDRQKGFYSESKVMAQRAIKDCFIRYGIPNASAHWCRHTFATLCEKYDVRDADVKRMLGHKLSDITTGVYSHRQIEDLRKQIEKIPSPSDL